MPLSSTASNGPPETGTVSSNDWPSYRQSAERRIRVAAALARDGADRAHHVRRRDQVRAIRRVGQGHPEPPRDLRLEDLVGARGVELHGAAGELRRIQE